jgi:hypothetical protein
MAERQPIYNLRINLAYYYISGFTGGMLFGIFAM